MSKSIVPLSHSVINDALQLRPLDATQDKSAVAEPLKRRVGLPEAPPHNLNMAMSSAAPPLPDVAGVAEPFAIDTQQPHGWAADKPLPAMFALSILSQLLLTSRQLQSRVRNTASQARHRQAQQSADASLQETRGNRSSALWNCSTAMLGATSAILMGGGGAYFSFVNDRICATTGAALNAGAQASSQVINNSGNALDTWYGGKHTADVARNAKEVSKYYEQLAQGNDDNFSRGTENAQKSFQSVVDAMRSLADMRSQTAREIANNLRAG